MWIIRANDFETVFVSPEIAEILGSTRDEMIGHSALPFFTVAGDTVRATSDLKRSEVLWVGHAGLRRFVRRDGSAVTLHAESHPVYDARGQLTHVAAVFAAESAPAGAIGTAQGPPRVEGGATRPGARSN
jgi:PAS domain S-box-containing protein